MQQLLAGGDYADDPHKAAKSAADALAACEAGNTTRAAAAAACEPLIEVFHQLLHLVPLRRLRAAQAEAAASP